MRQQKEVFGTPALINDDGIAGGSQLLANPQNGRYVFCI